MNKDYKMHLKCYYLAGTITILSNLARQDVSKGRECIIHGLVVNRLVQILDENISNSGSSQGGVTLAPHDPDWASFENIKVHGVQSSFS